MYTKARRVFLIGLAALGLVACNNSDMRKFTSKEISLINSTDSIMRVLTIEDSLDLAVLRAPSTDLSAGALLSEDFARLSDLMVATVTDPSQDGVGIAGPQVGLNRRVIAVQRFDKEDKDCPFEVYANIRIVEKSEATSPGSEGCLSVPDMRGEVLRSQEIIIEYADMKALSSCYPDGSEGKAAGCRQLSDCIIPTVRDTIKGFTAVIFQHEIDHLDGILYTDRL
jgi:peptide deformylase